MKVANRYLSYLLKKNLLRTVIFTAISVIICFIVVDAEAGSGVVRYRATGIASLAVMLSVFSVIIPMLELADFKNRRNLDTLYFFPIERKKMAVVHFISGFVQLAVIYTVAFAVAYIYLLMTTNFFALGYMIPYYFASLGLGFVMYSIFAFIFNQGNTVVDGLILCALWSIVACVVAWAVMGTFVKIGVVGAVWDDGDYQKWNEINQFTSWGTVFAPINNLTVIFRDLIEVNRHEDIYNSAYAAASRYTQQMYMFFVWGAVGIAAAIGFIFSFARKGANMAGEISSSWFGYKTLIPVYGYSIILYLATTDNFDTLLILTYIMMLIGYIIYRRSFKIKKSDIVVMVCSVIPIIVGIVLQSMMPRYM